MDEQIKQIAIRLKGLRDVLDLTTRNVAQACGISEEKMHSIKIGRTEYSRKYITSNQPALRYRLICTDVGDEPRMNAYFLTRKGKGAAVERTKAYKYQIYGSRIYEP